MLSSVCIPCRFVPLPRLCAAVLGPPRAQAPSAVASVRTSRHVGASAWGAACLGCLSQRQTVSVSRVSWAVIYVIRCRPTHQPAVRARCIDDWCKIRNKNISNFRHSMRPPCTITVHASPGQRSSKNAKSGARRAGRRSSMIDRVVKRSGFRYYPAVLILCPRSAMRDWHLTSTVCGDVRVRVTSRQRGRCSSSSSEFGLPLFSSLFLQCCGLLLAFEVPHEGHCPWRVGPELAFSYLAARSWPRALPAIFQQLRE